jgi:predicted transcriptional regulator YdeE
LLEGNRRKSKVANGVGLCSLTRGRLKFRMMKPCHAAIGVLLLIAAAMLVVTGEALAGVPMHDSLEAAAFDVIGISARTTNAAEATGNGAIPKQWQRLFMENLVSQIPDRLDQSIIAVYTDYASDADGEYTYVLGAKVKPGTKAPKGMVLVPVPAGRYLEFDTAKGPGAKVLPPAWQEIYGYFQTRPNPARAFKTDYEIYSDMSDPNAVQAHIYIGVK